MIKVGKLKRDGKCTECKNAIIRNLDSSFYVALGTNQLRLCFNCLEKYYLSMKLIKDSL